MVKPSIRPLLNSLGVVAYVAIVAGIMRNGEQLFGKEDTFFMMIGFLLLLCLSAATVGSLVFGYPIVQFLNGQKREGVRSAIMTILWLLLETVIGLSVVAVIH